MSREYQIAGTYVSDAEDRDFALPDGFLAKPIFPTPPDPGGDNAGKAKIWTGSAWGYKPVKYWTGSAWVTKSLKIWNGTAWVAYPVGGETGPGLLPLRFKSISSVPYASRNPTVVTAPGGINNGDLLIAFGVARAPSGPYLYPPVGQGWQFFNPTMIADASDNRVWLHGWWKRANNESGSYTFAQGNTVTTEIAIAVYEGALENGNPIDAFANYAFATGTTATAPSITTTLANELLLIIGHNWDVTGSTTPPSGYTERLDDVMQLMDNTDSGAIGATGDKAYPITLAPWQSWHVAIKPATGVVGSYVSPQFRSALYTSYSSGRTSTILGKPAGTLQNDIILASLFQGYGSNMPVDPSPPDGTWTQIGTPTAVSAGGFQGKFTIWWKRAGPSEPADYTFTQGGNAYSTQLMLASYSGCPTTGSPIDVFSQNSSNGSSTSTAYGIATTQDAVRLIYLAHNWDATGTLDFPISYGGVGDPINGWYGMVERIDHLTYLSDEVWTVAGGTYARQQALAGGGGWGAFLIGLKGIPGAVATVQPFTLRQSAFGGSSLATTPVSFSMAPTPGNLIVLGFSAENINGTPDAGWTQSTDMEQVNYHGGYVWWQISDGSNSLQYTINSALASHWVLMEFEGPFAGSPYDMSAGQNVVSNQANYSTPTITPSVGNRLLIAGWGFTRPGAYSEAWLGATNQDFSAPIMSADNTRTTGFSMSYRVTAANGTDSFGPTLTTNLASAAQTGQIISFKGA